jgi:16S rRNA processing protein RimM
MKRPDSTPTSSFIQIGVITSAHGIRGQVKLRSFTHTPEDIFKYAPISDKSGRTQYVLKREGYKEQLFIASIDGIADRNAAEALKGTALYASVEQAPPTGENEWLYSELEGLEARTEDGNAYGVVTGVYNFGAGDIIDIKKHDGSSEMLAFTKIFVGDVCVADGYLVVFPPDYIGSKEDDK